MSRIGVGLIATALLVLIASIVSVYALNSVIREREILTDQFTRDLLVVERLQLATEQRIASSRAFLVTGQTDFLTTVREQDRHFEELLIELTGQISPKSPEAAQLRAVERAYLDHVAATSRIFSMKMNEKHAPTQVAKAFEREVLPRTVNLRNALTDLVHRFSTLRQEQNVHVKTAELHFQRLVLTISFATLLLASVVLTLALRGIRDRTRAAIEAQQLLDQLREALRIRDEFISVASHELRTPITSLKLQTGLLERRLSEEADPAKRNLLRRPLQIFSRQIERLNQLVENMLDITQITSSKMPLYFEEFDLRDVIVTVAERLEGVLRASGSSLSLALPEALPGRWDRSRFEQVFENLFSNAAKYGRGQPIEVRALADEESFRIEVEDHGIGVPEQDQARVFERFERAVPSSKISGLGLGLFITRYIVENHGGRISMASKPGYGTTITLILPKKVPAALARTA